MRATETPEVITGSVLQAKGKNCTEKSRRSKSAVANSALEDFRNIQHSVYFRRKNPRTKKKTTQKTAISRNQIEQGRNIVCKGKGEVQIVVNEGRI